MADCKNCGGSGFYVNEDGLCKACAKYATQPHEPLFVRGKADVTLRAVDSALVLTRGYQESSIPISSILSITLTPPLSISTGMLEIVTAQASSAFLKISSGITASIGSMPSIVMKNNAEYPYAVQIRDYVLSYHEKQTVPDSTRESVSSCVAEIRQFKQLLDEGIITQEEFDTKKAQLLGI